MSVHELCAGCYRGDHSAHVHGHGTLPGLLGGRACNCIGDCKPSELPTLERKVAALFGLIAEFDNPAAARPADPDRDGEA